MIEDAPGFTVILDGLAFEHNRIKNLPFDNDRSHALYYSVYKNAQGFLGHYCRYLYNIFQFIDNPNVQIDVSSREFYSKQVRAQLSNTELAVLYYNCVSEYGREKFMPYAEKYGLFKNLPLGLLLRPDHFYLYARGAWGSNYKKLKIEADSLIDESGLAREVIINRQDS